MSELTHFNAAGQSHMVDVGDKQSTARRAVAEGRIRMLPATLETVRRGDHRKGDVLGVAAKRPFSVLSSVSNKV